MEQLLLVLFQLEFIGLILTVSTCFTFTIFNMSTTTTCSCSTGEVKVHLERVGAKVLVCTMDNKDVAIKVAEESPSVQAIFVLGLQEESISKAGQPILSLGKAFDTKADIGNVQIPVKMNSPREKAIAFILPSSGTTGHPKGVIRSHLNTMSAFADFDNFDDRLFGGSEDTASCHQPMPHASGCWTIMYSLVYAVRTVIYRGFEEELFCNIVQKYKVTHAFLAPSHLNLLMKYEYLDKYDFSSLRHMTTGGSPVPKYVSDVFQVKLKNFKNLRQGYGSSEAGMITSTPMTLVMPETSGTINRVNVVKIVDLDTGKSLSFNEVGEIYVKGPEVSPGYWKNEEANAENFTLDGWLKTGDAGYFTIEGLFFIVDRYKDVIKVDTQQVAPVEIETLLLKHEFVHEAAVIGIPDETHGEVPKAFVVLKPHFKDRPSATEEIRQVIDSQVGEWKKLRGGIHLLPKMPLIGLGKIDKKSLKLL